MDYGVKIALFLRDDRLALFNLLLDRLDLLSVFLDFLAVIRSLLIESRLGCVIRIPSAIEAGNCLLELGLSRFDPTRELGDFLACLGKRHLLAVDGHLRAL